MLRVTLFSIYTLLCLTANLVDAQDRTTEKDEAQILDPDQECKPYQFPFPKTVAFPDQWKQATILPSDTVALNKWNAITPNVPNIAVRTENSTQDPADPTCYWPTNQCTTPKLPNIPPDVAVIPEPNTLGYGFDDGPNCSHNAFYDYLQSKNQKATMFFIGSSVMYWPLEAQRALADGHEICAHTWSHPSMTTLQSKDAFAELYYSVQAIKFVVGVTPTCWRPPRGDIDDRIRYIANALGLTTILWTRDSFDWAIGSNVIVKGGQTVAVTPDVVDSNYQSLINDASSGAFNSQGVVMLTHEVNNFTMSEAVKHYEGLAGSFKYLVPVGVALNKTQPYIEKNYSLPTFDQYIGGLKTSNATSNGTSDGEVPGSAATPLPAFTGKWIFLAVGIAWELNALL